MKLTHARLGIICTCNKYMESDRWQATSGQILAVAVDEKMMGGLANHDVENHGTKEAGATLT